VKGDLTKYLYQFLLVSLYLAIRETR